MARYWRQGFLLFLLALFCAPLLAHISLGSYSRFIADDFCSSATARSQGIIRGALHWYMNWNGRFSANLLDSVFGYLGPRATPYATGLVVTIWFIVLASTAFQIIPRRNEREVQLLESCVIAAMLLFAALHVIPFIGQSLYWGQGMRSVIPPLILGTAYVALLANRSRSAAPEKLRSGWLISAAVLTFIATGFAETYFAAQTTAIVFALAICLASRRRSLHHNRSWLLLLGAGLLGSLLGGLLMFVAPGNKFRQNPFPPPPAPPELLSISWRGMHEFFDLVVRSHGYVWVGLLACGFIFGLGALQQSKELEQVRQHVWKLMWLPVVAFVLLLSCWVPMAWGTSLTLAYRTFIIPAYVLVCLTTYWAYVAGRVCSTFSLVRRQPALVTMLASVVLLAFGLFAADVSRKIWGLRPTFAGYARRWDERDQIIQTAKSQGLTYAVVLRLHNWAALDEIAVDPKITWLTKCVHDYYGINVIPDLGDLYGEPNGEAKQAALERQFEAIQKLQGSIPTDLNRIYKSDRGKIVFYKVGATPDQIKSYYEMEFARLGWKHIGEKKVEAFQRFSGGTQNLFCNGDSAATLFVTAQDEERLGYTYSLALNWGMSSGFTWGVVDCKE